MFQQIRHRLFDGFLMTPEASASYKKPITVLALLEQSLPKPVKPCANWETSLWKHFFHVSQCGGQTRKHFCEEHQPARFLKFLCLHEFQNITFTFLNRKTIFLMWEKFQWGNKKHLGISLVRICWQAFLLPGKNFASAWQNFPRWANR